MINYNIINEFIEKLKAGKTTASDINAIAEAYKNGELTNTVNLIEVENIKAIPSSVLEDLNCGDIVVKNENGNKHAYVVTYKEHHQGICLTYVDASMCETQSYDYVGSAWVYNSQDTFTFVNYTAGTGIDITSGVISGAYTAGTGINITNGEISASSSSKYYMHNIHIGYNGSGSIMARLHITIITDSAAPFTKSDDENTLHVWLTNKGIDSADKAIACSGVFTTSDNVRRSIMGLFVSSSSNFGCAEYDSSGLEQSNNIPATSSNVLIWVDTVIEI